MLTRRQIQSHSLKAGVSLHTVEREYVQTLLLYELYKQSTDFLFKGGTCLRMGYGLNRYSEDLDFNYNAISGEGMKIITIAATGLIDFGIESTVKKINESPSGFTSKLRYNGPLYDGNNRSRGTIKIDVSCRKEPVETTSKLITPAYDDCPSFVCMCLTLDHILAEKVRALVIRGKPRDLYDIWFLREHVDFDLALINKKLKLYNITFQEVHIDEILSDVERDWKQDILPLLGFLPDISEIITPIGKKLKQVQKVNGA